MYLLSVVEWVWQKGRLLKFPYQGHDLAWGGESSTYYSYRKPAQWVIILQGEVECGSSAEGSASSCRGKRWPWGVSQHRLYLGHHPPEFPWSCVVMLGWARMGVASLRGSLEVMESPSQRWGGLEQIWSKPEWCCGLQCSMVDSAWLACGWGSPLSSLTGS